MPTSEIKWWQKTDILLSITDTDIKYKRNGRYIHKYRSKCPQCGKDKGYQKKIALGKICHQCNAKKAAITGKNWAGKGKEVMAIIKSTRAAQKMTPCSEEKKQKISNSNKRTKKEQFYNKHGYYSTDVHKSIRHNVSSSMNTRLRRRGAVAANKSKIKSLDYNIDELIRHLENQFVDDMSWDNYGNKTDGRHWEIDHITPDSWFNYQSIDDDEFKKCWALDNLQPMWSEDNCKKSNKYKG